MPSRERAYGGNAVMSVPSKMIWPPDDGMSPETRLNSVVFPAPFGPITPRASPAATVTLTPSTALSAPKNLETSFNCKSGIISPTKLTAAALSRGGFVRFNAAYA